MLLMTVALTACQSIQGQLQMLHAQGRYADARHLLEDPRTRDEVYGTRDAVLWRLETASANMACGDYQRAVGLLDDAETYTAYNYDRTGGEALAQWALNDSAAAYAAQPYEDLYVNVLKQICFLHLGDLNNAAAESRRMLDKSKSLGGFMQEHLRRAESGDTSGVVRDATNRFRSARARGNDYITSPLGAYLAALVAAKNGNPAGQDEAATRLRQAIGEQQRFIGSINPGAFDTVGSISPDSFDVIAIGFSGRGPVKESRQVDAPLAAGQRTEIPFPMIRRGLSSRVTGAWIEFASGPSEPGATAPAPPLDRHPLQLVEDLGAVVAENFALTEPAIYARTIARIAIKAGLVAGAAYGVHASGKDDRWTALTVLAGLAYIALTEHADLRSWVMLPGQAWVAAVKAPVGADRARIVYSLPGGREVSSEWRPIHVTSGAPATVVTYMPD
ncbi:MAG: hypothetical protein AB7G11_05640 [Phycisphaerales bacterium]